MEFGSHYLQDLIDQFGKLKALADGAVAQVTDSELFRTIDSESNSMAIIMRHVGGNLRSRYSEFLTTDGEKPDRHRDAEFEMPEGTTRETVVAAWDGGFTMLFRALRALGPDDLGRDVFIGGHKYTTVEALNRSLTHTAMHVGQLVFLAKHLRAAEWRTLSIPRGQSETFKRPRV